MSFIDLCRQFIAIDTSPQAGTREAADWVERLARSYGLEVDIQAESLNGLDQANIFIRTGVPQKEELLLQSHLDTVNPGSPSHWTENMLNPFNAIIKDGKLYGLGACESKIDLLCKLESLRGFAKVNDWRIAPVIAGTFGGEIGMQGMLKAVRKNKFFARYALIGEPSGQNLVCAGKGYAILEFYVPFSSEEKEFRLEHNLKESVSTQSKFFKGKAVYSSEGQATENAINKAFEYLLQIPESVVIMDMEGGTNHNTVASNAVLELDFHSGIPDPMIRKLRHIYMLLQQISSEFLFRVDSDFSPPYPTMNLGLIKSHEDHIHLTVACRFPPIVSEETYRQWLEQIQNGTAMVGAQCRVTDYKRPYRTNLNSDFVRICEESLSPNRKHEKFVTQSFCSEMSLLDRMGVVSLGYGAGTRNDSTVFSNECVNISDLEQSIQFYRTVIERVCL